MWYTSEKKPPRNGIPNYDGFHRNVLVVFPSVSGLGSIRVPIRVLSGLLYGYLEGSLLQVFTGLRLKMWQFEASDLGGRCVPT